MDWIYQTLQWYGMLLLVGVVFFGITRKLLSSFFDQGYAFSKTVGILLLSYSIFLLGNLHIAPFHYVTLCVCLFIAFSISVFINRTNTKKIPWRIIVFEEVFFSHRLILLDLCSRSRTFHSGFGKIYGFWIYEVDSAHFLFSPP